MTKTLRIQVINGPNLNMLGRREPGIYGGTTLDDINHDLSQCASAHGAEVRFYQSNLEGELVTAIQQTRQNEIDGIVINPGAYTHTSIAIRDALLAVQIPFVEIHISNTFSREEFRHNSFLSDISSGVVIGFGPMGYELAMKGLIRRLQG